MINAKMAKKLRQGVKRQLNDTVRTFYDHILSKRPFWIPRFIWKWFLRWLISL